MHSFWIFFLKKRAFTYMVMFALVSAGLFSLVTIPKESSPEVVVPIGIVTTALRGAQAVDTEKLITNKLEEEIANIENIDKVTSSSREGVSLVTAQFSASADIDKAINDLKDAVDRAKVTFPTDATEPVVTKVNFSDQPIIIASISKEVSPSELTSLGDTLKSELKKIKGVSKVEVTGTRKKEVQVVLKKEELARYNVTIGQVLGAITSSNVSSPVGSITVSSVDYPITFAGTIQSANEIPNIAVANNNGVPVYLRDVAYIVDGLEDPKTFSRASLNGAPAATALTLNVFKKTGGDVTKIGEDVKEKINSLKEDILSDSQVVISFDRGDLVKKDLKELTRVGLETVTLVMLVLFLTIGWREAFVAGLSIPLSFVVAFIGLSASGNSINFISLFSLILAIGILVDSGIVVAEAIHTRMKTLKDGEQAAIATIKEYSWPLIAGTMTTVAVFAPLFFISGITGEFIKSIPFTIIFVLIASIFVALGMVPLLAVVLTKPHKNSFEDTQEKYSLLAREWYKNFLGKVLLNTKLQNRFFATLVIGFFVSTLLPVLGLVKVQFFPQDNQNFIFVTLEKPQGTPLSKTDLDMRIVEEVLYEEPYVESFVTTVGAGSSFDQNGGGASTKIGNITVLLKKDRELTSTEITEILREKLSSIKTADITVSQGNNGPPSGAPVVITFSGDDLTELSTVANKAQTLLSTIQGTLDVKSSLSDDGTQFEIVVDRNKASAAGLSSQSIAQILRGSVSGITATTIRKQSDDIDVVVKTNLENTFSSSENTNKATIDAITQLPVLTPTGKTILLGSVIDVRLTPARSVISHEDKKRIVSVSSNLQGKTTALEVVAEFKKKESELALPKSVTINYGGENEEVNNSFRDMFLALIAGMVGMLAILVLEFNSFRFAFYLLFTVPLSLIGVLGGLALTGQTLSFSSMLGFIALAGVIINHAIILLDSILHRLEKEKESGGEVSLHTIVVESSAIRLRPIILTTVTTVVGMIPLAGVSALWGPLAFAIMFGLSFAMILTLILVPVLFYRYPGKYKTFKK
jgi:multidrug efflux pump